jgi:hypothetical protein
MSGDTGWLDALEERVHQAAERLRALGEDNARLGARAAELERELTAERAARAAATAAGAPPDGDEAASWRRERDEVRRRVGKLAERLGELLAAAED